MSETTLLDTVCCLGCRTGSVIPLTQGAEHPVYHCACCGWVIPQSSSGTSAPEALVPQSGSQV